MSHHTYLVTGPTRGLGRQLVQTLSSRADAPNLLLVGRAGPTLTEVAEEARRRGAPEVATFPCDLGSLRQVEAAAEAIVTRCDGPDGRPINGVAANAALQMTDATAVTEDGYEMTSGVGLVAHHLLLRRLQPVLAPMAHLVFIGSGTHYGTFPATLMVPGPQWLGAAQLVRPADGPKAGSLSAGRQRYATTKLAVNYLCHEWNRRFGTTVRANIYDPGLMPGTGLVRDSSRLQRFAWRALMPALRVLPGVTSPEHSAECLAALLVGDVQADRVNAYFEIGREKPASAESDKPERERELFDILDEQLRGFLVPRPG